MRLLYCRGASFALVYRTAVNMLSGVIFSAREQTTLTKGFYIQELIAQLFQHLFLYVDEVFRE